MKISRLDGVTCVTIIPLYWTLYYEILMNFNIRPNNRLFSNWLSCKIYISKNNIFNLNFVRISRLISPKSSISRISRIKMLLSFKGFKIHDKNKCQYKKYSATLSIFHCKCVKIGPTLSATRARIARQNRGKHAERREFLDAHVGTIEESRRPPSLA